MQIDLLSCPAKYLREIIAKLQITRNKGPIWWKRLRDNLIRPNFLSPLNAVYGAISAYFSHFLPSLRCGKAKSRVLWRKYFCEHTYDCKMQQNLSNSFVCALQTISKTSYILSTAREMNIPRALRQKSELHFTICRGFLVFEIRYSAINPCI